MRFAKFNQIGIDYNNILDMRKVFSLLCVGVLMAVTSCDEINTFVMEDHQGAFILNQGTSTSSVSYYNYEQSVCENDYFKDKNNGQAIGSGAHTMAIRKKSEYVKGLAFIVFPEEGNISKINMDGFGTDGYIDAYDYPTDILVTGDDIAFISNGTTENDSKVYEYNYTNDSQVRAIDVAQYPTKMISSGKYLYAACKGNGTGAKVIVIDMSNGVKADTVDLAFDNPVDMVVDASRNVWVYCAGDTEGLVRLNREFVTEVLDVDKDNERDTTYITNEPTDFELGPKLNDSPNPLTVSIDGRTIYYVYGKLCSNNVYIEETETISQEAIISGDYQNEAFRSVDWDDKTGRIMALTSSGKLVILKNYSSSWSNEEVYDVGSNPMITTFNY